MAREIHIFIDLWSCRHLTNCMLCQIRTFFLKQPSVYVSLRLWGFATMWIWMLLNFKPEMIMVSWHHNVLSHLRHDNIAFYNLVTSGFLFHHPISATWKCSWSRWSGCWVNLEAGDPKWKLVRCSDLQISFYPQILHFSSRCQKSKALRIVKGGPKRSCLWLLIIEHQVSVSEFE